MTSFVRVWIKEHIGKPSGSTCVNIQCLFIVFALGLWGAGKRPITTGITKNIYMHNYNPAVFFFVVELVSFQVYTTIQKEFTFLLKLILLFSKDALNWSKVIKTSIMSQKISIFLKKKSQFPQKKVLSVLSTVF